MRDRAITTGIADLDALLGGLLPGDNVVWIGERGPVYEAVEHAFLTRAAADHPTVAVATSRRDLRRRLPTGAAWIDASPGSRLGRPHALAAELDRRMQSSPTCVVIDGLAALAQRWGTDEALRFFTRMCPSMLQAGAVTYWRMSRSLGSGFIDRVRQTTQCLLEVGEDQLRVVKAESRDEGVQDSVHRVRFEHATLTLVPSTTASRLARGLTAVRRDLGLTQAQVAAAAGITPSAVSQAEHGVRGLSVDTLLTLADRLGVSLDRLVSARPTAGYHLARHDRGRVRKTGSLVALADDARAGLRAYLVALAADERGAAPFAHKGVELVAVLRGLVQIEVGDDTPVLRASDTLLATSASISGWRNLGPEPAGFYWILRD